MNQTYGMIGCGAMGSILATAFTRAVDPKQVFLANRTPEKAEQLALKTGASFSSTEEIAANCGMIFLGVKPQGLRELFDEIRPILNARTDRFVLVSMAAGATIASIREMSGDYPVIRIMPNIPAAVGEGITVYHYSGLEPEETNIFLKLMAPSGKLLGLRSEQLIDASTALSGCGPAFACMFIEAMADGGVKCGLSRANAQLLAAQTLLGSAKLLLESGKHPGELKDMVCSPAGTAIAGVLALENGTFRWDTSKAVITAYEQALKLG